MDRHKERKAACTASKDEMIDPPLKKGIYFRTSWYHSCNKKGNL